MAAPGAVPSGETTVLSASIINLSVASLMTCRTRCGVYCCTTSPFRSSRRFTSIGRMSQPPFAMAHMAMSICSRVTATPCPIGICAMETLLHFFTGCKIPLTSPGNGMPVRWPKPYSSRIIVKPVFAEADADFGRADVRRFCDDALGGENPKRLVVMQNPPRISEMTFFAIKRVAQMHHAIVQRAGHHHNLERRTGFHHVADDAVAARVGGRGAGIVRIKIRQCRHRQDFARARTHDDAGDADGCVFLHGVGQRGFDNVLNGRIQGEHDIEAIACLHVLIAQRNQFPLLPVRFRHAPARHAAQRGIQIQFDAVAS